MTLHHLHVALQRVAVSHGNGQEKSLLERSQSEREVATRGQMDEGMVPVSWLSLRYLQQWEHEAKTIQREDDKDGVRFISTQLAHLSRSSTDRRHQAAGEEERPHLQDSQAREVPQAVGDGAGQLVGVEEPAAVRARGQDHAKRGRQRRSQIHKYQSP